MMKIDGACHCGAITFRAEVDPAQVGICHCTDCQTLTGTAFRVFVPAAEESFAILTGRPRHYIKTAESGARRVQAFCPDCGTPLYSTSAGDGPKTYGIRVGSVRQRAELPPRTQYWCRSAQAWLPTLGALPRVERE
jgi:hypothetical protein